MNSLTVTSDCRRIAASVPPGKFPVNRDNHSSAPLIAEFHMTTSLPDLCKANLLERSDGLLTGNNG